MNGTNIKIDCQDYDKQWEAYKLEIQTNLDQLKRLLIDNQSSVKRFMDEEYKHEYVVWSKTSQNKELISKVEKCLNVENQIKHLDKFMHCDHEFISTGYSGRTQTYYRCEECGSQCAVDVNGKLLF